MAGKNFVRFILSSNESLTINENITGDISNLNAGISAKVVNIQKNHNIYGNISVFDDKQYLESLMISDTDISGNIDDIRHALPHLTDIALVHSSSIGGDFKYLALLGFEFQGEAYIDTAITGSIEDFVAVKRGLGQTTGSRTFSWLGDGNRISFNGVYFTNKASYTLSWTATTITFDGVQINNNDVEVVN